MVDGAARDRGVWWEFGEVLVLFGGLVEGGELGGDVSLSCVRTLHFWCCLFRSGSVDWCSAMHPVGVTQFC